MKHGFVVDGWDLRTIGDLSEEAESAGWDGLFISDAVAIGGTGEFPDFDFFDPWIGLAVIAMRTRRMRIGTMITPLPRRRPWKLARETLSIDHLSNGRLIFGTGLGAAEHDGGFYKVGEEMDLKRRAQRLDEGLAILTGLWGGKPYSFDGEHYQVNEMTMIPSPVQKPRIPIWVPGVWQKKKSMARALRWDGIIPQKHKSMSRMTVTEIRALTKYVNENRRDSSAFDIIAGGETNPAKKEDIKKIQNYEKAGATWWLESKWTFSADEVRERVKQGPAREK